MEPVTKSKFAEQMQVSAGRVSQWLKNGQIPPDAIVGSGRYAKIRPDVAMQHLRSTLDVSQMTGNGLGTNLETDLAETPTAAAAKTDPVDTFEMQLRREKLEQAQIETRRKRAEENARTGRYVLAADAEVAMAKMAGQLIAYFDGGISDMATAIAAEFKLPQRDVVHTLRKQFTLLRERAEVEAKAVQAKTPQHIADEAVTGTDA